LSAEFSHILLRSLWRLASFLHYFILFIIFLSFLFPSLLFSYLFLLLEFVFLTLQNYLPSPSVKLLPSDDTVWHLSLDTCS
jgi:hypothetical protein